MLKGKYEDLQPTKLMHQDEHNSKYNKVEIKSNNDSRKESK